MADGNLDRRETLAQFFSVARGRADLSVIDERIESAAVIDGIHMLQLICAMLIASIGLNINSTEAVIGAMLICPLMGSVVDLAYAVATMKPGAFQRALMGLTIQVVVCLATSTLYFSITPLGQKTAYLQSFAETTIWTLIIALVGGFAGGLGISRHETPSTLISGVAVATALMPPLCTVGYGLASANALHALYALYLFFVNVVFIGLGAEIVFMGLGIPLMADYNGDGVTDNDEKKVATKKQKILRFCILVFAVFFSIPCIYYTQDKITISLNEGNITVVQDTYKVEFTTAQLKALIDDYVDFYVADEHFFNDETQALETRVVATVVCGEIPSERTQGKVEELILLNSANISNVVFMKKVGDKWIGDPRNSYEVIEEEVPLTGSDKDQKAEPLEKVVEDIKKDVRDKAEEAQAISEALQESKEEAVAEPGSTDQAT